MVQRALAWAILAVFLILLIAGFVGNGLFGQPVWTPGGLVRFAGFAAAYAGFTAAMLRWQPRWYLPALAGLVLLYTMVAVGPLAPAALGYFAVSCYAVGAIWFRRNPEFTARNPHLTVLTGLATWTFFVLVTATAPVHYRVLYWVLPAVPVYYSLRFQWLPALKFEYPRTAHDLAPLSVALFPLVCHWLVALKPEVSADGMAMHMVVASRLASEHVWRFDVHQYLWAAMPLGGDFLYSIGWQLASEPGARLMNLAVLGLIVWILSERLHARVPGWVSGLLVAAYLSTPLTQQATGSLQPANVEAVTLLGAALLLRAHVKERRGIYFYASCLLTGIAMTTTLGSLAFAAALLVAAVILVKFRHLVLGLPVALAVGGYPYFSAWIRTSNPVFPLFDAVFHSPMIAAQTKGIDPAAIAKPEWRLWYDLTFHTSRYSTGLDGSLGFFYFLLVPVALVGVRRRWPRTGFVLLWVALAGLVATFAGRPVLGDVYPALPMLTLLAGVAISSYRAHGPLLGRVLGWATGLTVVLNLCFLPAAGPYHRDFAWNQAFGGKGVDQYLAEQAPQRKLVDWMNANDADSRAAWMESDAIGDYRGVPFVNSWRSQTFWNRLRATTSAEGQAYLAQDLKIRYFLAPLPGSRRPISSPYARDFLDTYTTQVATFSDWELRKWAPPQPGVNGPPPAYAPPGEYDDVTRYSHFTGPWSRDLEFPQAYDGTLVYSNDTRSRVIIRFRGQSIRLKYTAAANRCPGLVSLDDGDEQRLGEYAPETKWQTLSPEYVAAAPGDHVIQLRFPEGVSKQPVASCYLDLDGFVVR